MSNLPWYKSFWKIIIVLILCVVVLVGVAFALLVYQEVTKINTGEVSEFTNQANLLVDPDELNFKPGIGDDPYIGDPEAPVQIIAFEDFQCPFCKRAVPIMKSILKKYPDDVVYVYKDFPLETIHLQSKQAALAGNCADEQGEFWILHDLLFENQADFADTSIYSTLAEKAGLDVTEFDACLSDQRSLPAIQQDQDEGFLAEVQSTPTYFVNGVKIEGLLSEQQWIDIIESVLEATP